MRGHFTAAALFIFALCLCSVTGYALINFKQDTRRARGILTVKTVCSHNEIDPATNASSSMSLETTGVNSDSKIRTEEPSIMNSMIVSSPKKSTKSPLLALQTVAGAHKSVLISESRKNITISSPSSRRDWFSAVGYTVGGCVMANIGAKATQNPSMLKNFTKPTKITRRLASTNANTISTKSTRKLAPVNISQVIQETNVNLTLECTSTCVTLDSKNFRKLESLNLPSWLPSFLIPAPKVIKDISNYELLAAGTIAGSFIEMGRTMLLYPLLTLKTRIQSSSTGLSHRRLRLCRRLNIKWLSAKRHLKEGKLYAGLLPSLLVTVPATGVYFGVRDVAKRVLAPLLGVPQSDLSVAVSAVFLADAISLVLRTPADTLALRLQAASGVPVAPNDTIYTDNPQDSCIKDNPLSFEEAKEAQTQAMVGNWFIESLERLPTVIITDVPYLVLKVALMAPLIQLHKGTPLDMVSYEVTAVSSAILAALLTTPFDVARTRILVDSDGDPRNGLDGGSRSGVLKTIQSITKEGGGGLPNLFAGWFERTLYLGVGRTFLEPILVVGYIAIRDAILLEFFD